MNVIKTSFLKNGCMRAILCDGKNHRIDTFDYNGMLKKCSCKACNCKQGV